MIYLRERSGRLYYIFLVVLAALAIFQTLLSNTLLSTGIAFITFVTALAAIKTYSYFQSNQNKVEYEAAMHKFEAERKQSFLDGLLRALPEWIRVVDCNGNVKFINQQLRRDVVNPFNRCWELFGRKKCTECTSRQALADNSICRRTIKYGQRTYLLTCAPIIESDGTSKAAVEIITDISRLALLRQSIDVEITSDTELAETFVLLNEAIDTLEDAVVVSDMQGNIFYTNQAFTQLTQLLDPDGQIPNKLNVLLGVDNIPKANVVFVVPRANQYYCYCKILRNSFNEPHRIVVVIRDMSTVTQLNEKLRQDHQLLYRVVNTLEVGLLVIDRQTLRTKWVNTQVKKMFGVSENITHCFELFGSTKQCDTCQIENVLNAKGGVTYTVYHGILDRHFRINLSTLGNGDVMMVVSDITLQVRDQQTRLEVLGQPRLQMVERLQTTTMDLQKATAQLVLTTQKSKHANGST